MPNRVKDRFGLSKPTHARRIDDFRHSGAIRRSNYQGAVCLSWSRSGTPHEITSLRNPHGSEPCTFGTG